MQVHAYAVKIGFHSFLSIGNVQLIERNLQLECFNSVPEPNLVTWTSIIGAYAFNSLPRDYQDVRKDVMYKGRAEIS